MSKQICIEYQERAYDVAEREAMLTKSLERLSKTRGVVVGIQHLTLGDCYDQSFEYSLSWTERDIEYKGTMLSVSNPDLYAGCIVTFENNTKVILRFADYRLGGFKYLTTTFSLNTFKEVVRSEIRTQFQEQFLQDVLS